VALHHLPNEFALLECLRGHSADSLVNLGYSVQGSVWLVTLPKELHLDFSRDKVGFPDYRFR